MILKLPGLLLTICLSGMAIAHAQSPAPPAGAPAAKPADAVDAIAAWRRLDVSRAAVRDQLELCDDDAGRFQQIGRELRPSGGAENGEWSEWAVLLRTAALELQSCLRAYKKQIGLLVADTKALRDMLPTVKDAKRMTLGPKQLAEATKAADDAEREIAAADAQVAAWAEGADRLAGEALRLLRQAGVAKAEPLPSFKNLL
jgi:hypothetical protein